MPEWEKITMNNNPELTILHCMDLAKYLAHIMGGIMHDNGLVHNILIGSDNFRLIANVPHQNIAKYRQGKTKALKKTPCNTENVLHGYITLLQKELFDKKNKLDFTDAIKLRIRKISKGGWSLIISAGDSSKKTKKKRIPATKKKATNKKRIPAAKKKATNHKK